MQKSRTNGLSARGTALTGWLVPPILLVYVPSVRHRSDVLLLLSDAGVWVGLAKFFQPTRQRGWVFVFIRILSWAPGRVNFRNIQGQESYGGHK